MSTQTTLLAIETSCDETGVAIVQKKNNTVSILANEVASQVDIHKVTGGVVPEVAAREHVSVLRPMIEKVMGKANMTKDDIDAIAVTVGPGLMPALSVGVTAAKTLAYAWQKPVVPVHHIEGHIYSALLNQGSSVFPALALIVSGGHTLLIEVTNHVTYKIIGSTIDDAAGEAFDKVARLIGLGYPGGPAISKLAPQGNPQTYHFPRPMMKSQDLNFSFSGLKTAVLYTWRDIPDSEQKTKQADIAASFEQAVVDVLVTKTQTAIQTTNPKVVLLAGGVAANNKLGQALQEMAKKNKVELRVAPMNLTGDNAAMIGQAAVFAYEAGRQKTWVDVDAAARVSIENFSIA